MKKKFILILIIFLICEAKSYSQDFWSLLDRNVQAEAISTNSNRHIFANVGNVIRSINNGNTWEEVYPYAIPPSLMEISINPLGYIFIYPDFTIWRSIDNGNTWSQVLNDTIPLLDAHINNNNIIYISAMDNGQPRLIKSINNGNSWEDLQSPNEGLNYIVANNDNDIFVTSGNGSFGKKVFKSINNGNSWVEILQVDSIITGLFIDVNDNLYLGTKGGGVYKSINDGNSWVNIGLKNKNILRLVANSLGHIFVAPYFQHTPEPVGVFATMDNGANWISLNSGFELPWVYDLTCGDNDVIYASTSTGIYSSLPPTESSVTLVSHGNGTILNGLRRDTIRWIENNVSNVKLEFSNDNGSTWDIITDNVSNPENFYVWTVPNVNSNECKIRISRTNNPNIFHTSNNFAINKTREYGNGALVINNSPCAIKFNENGQSGVFRYEINFDFKSSNKEPQNFVNHKLEIPSDNNEFCFLDENILSDFVPGVYNIVLYNQFNQVLGERVIMKINLIAPSNTAKSPLLLVHGWQSDELIWNPLMNNLESIYSPWIIEYPNTGDIYKSSWALSRVIDSISEFHNNSQVRILAHSMGGLLSRTVSIGNAKDLSGNTVTYNGLINYLCFLATPNKGGRFAEFDEKSGFIADLPQYAVSQLGTTSEFIRVLNSNNINSLIKYLSIAGYDNNYANFVLPLQIRNNSTFIKIYSSILNSLGPNDCAVNVRSAISHKNDFFSQYKFVYKNHKSIYQNPTNEVVTYLTDFFEDGSIVSDNYYFFRFKLIVGEIVSHIPLDGLDKKIGGALITLVNENSNDTFYTYSNFNGKFSFSSLRSGSYKIIIKSEGFVSDSSNLEINDTLSQVVRNFNLMENTSYVGTINNSVEINSNNFFTNSLFNSIAFHSENAVQIMISEELDFSGASWQPFSSNINYQFLDSSYGMKILFAKFKDQNNIESNIVYDLIEYDSTSSAQLTIASSPPDAQIMINGNLVPFVTPHTFNNIPLGDYEITLSKSGFESQPTSELIHVINSQNYNVSFTFNNLPPQKISNFIYNYNIDTLLFKWDTPSDADLNRVKITYRTDGRFPNNPDDGINFYNETNLPDQEYEIIVSNLTPGGNYYFSTFTVDSLGLYSDGYDTNIVYLPTNITNQNEIPSEFMLYNSFPNPFNPVTKIKFDIPKISSVKLIVYDILGRNVEILVSKEFSPGRYEYSWDASNFASGVYFYRLEAGEFTDVKRMVVVK